MPNKKVMPTEHRIPEMKEGQIFDIQNPHGKFILVKLPTIETDYGFKINDLTTVVKNINDHLESQNEATREVINEKSQDYANDQK
jgi:hypothetical protein